jgi:dolichol-phosphate mannosyltransferase
MDSDFSHPPEDLPKLFEGLKQADIVVASRLAPGAVDERPFLRKFITYLANIYARFFMDHHSHRSHIRDWTTGYRAYRKVVFERVPPQNLISQGPSVVQEVLWRAMNQGSTAIEIPFHMINRAQGKSSFNSKVAKQSIFSIIGYWILFRPGDSQVRFYENAPQEFIKVSERFYQIHQKKV